MADVTWIKLYIDMFDKRKIKKLRRHPAGNELLLIWIMLLATAGKCNAGGMIFITESVPFTEEDLADELGFEVSTIKLALKALEELDMIERPDNGFINVVGWEEHQNADRLAEIREYNRLAKQKSREKQKLHQAGSDNVNDMSMTCQRCHDTEEEGEKDTDKDKDTLSIYAEKNDSEKVVFPESVERQRTFLGGELGKGVVLLSQEQIEDLLERLSFDEFNHYVRVIADCILSGKRYKKTHYQAILDMAAADRKCKK